MLSVVIPVYNNWPLTAQCLRSLARTSTGVDLEVIVVDNASSDETQEACRALGRELFPARFLYERMDVNINFSGAINRGAERAHGDFLFWLNNDTVLLPNWYPPLAETFASDARLGAVGPVLLFPEDHGQSRVQHAGIVFSLGLQVSHLYEGFPADHLNIAKKHALQAITGAAFYIPRERFLALGGLDERFINGFEDIEFCDRLCRQGYVQTVVPSSRIVHISKQSAGRSAHEAENSALCTELCSTFRVDKLRLLREDGYQLTVSPWLYEKRLVIQPICPALHGNFSQCPMEDLANAVRNEPYWISGGLLLAKRLEAEGLYAETFAAYQSITSFCTTPDVLIPFALFLLRRDPTSLPSLLPAFTGYVLTEEERLTHCYAQHKLLLAAGEPQLARQVTHVCAKNAAFFATAYKRFYDCLLMIKARVH